MGDVYRDVASRARHPVRGGHQVWFECDVHSGPLDDTCPDVTVAQAPHTLAGSGSPTGGRKAAGRPELGRAANDNTSKRLLRKLETESCGDRGVASTAGLLLQAHIALLIARAPALSVEQQRCLRDLITSGPAFRLRLT